MTDVFKESDMIQTVVPDRYAGAGKKVWGWVYEVKESSLVILTTDQHLIECPTDTVHHLQ
jgi:hypothetical protein